MCVAQCIQKETFGQKKTGQRSCHIFWKAGSQLTDIKKQTPEWVLATCNQAQFRQNQIQQVGTAWLTQQMPFKSYILMTQPEETDKSMPMALQQPYQLYSVHHMVACNMPCPPDGTPCTCTVKPHRPSVAHVCILLVQRGIISAASSFWAADT